MTDDRLRRADALQGQWPDLAAYMRQMAGEAEREPVEGGETVVTDDDGDWEEG